MSSGINAEINAAYEFNVQSMFSKNSDSLGYPLYSPMSRNLQEKKSYSEDSPINHMTSRQRVAVQQLLSEYAGVSIGNLHWSCVGEKNRWKMVCDCHLVGYLTIDMINHGHATMILESNDPAVIRRTLVIEQNGVVQVDTTYRNTIRTETDILLNSLVKHAVKGLQEADVNWVSPQD